MNRERNRKPPGTGKLIAITITLILAITVALYAISRSIWHAAEHYAPLTDASMEIMFNTTQFHLWFEEYIEGDKSVTESRFWEHLESAKWYTQAMLKGGHNQEWAFIPLDDPDLMKNIREVAEILDEMHAIAKDRLQQSKHGKVGSDIDQEFDAVFNSVLEKADLVETRLQKAIAREILEIKSNISMAAWPSPSWR